MTGDAGPRGLANGYAVASRERFTPDALRATGWWVNWVRALPFDDDGTVDWDGTPTKQPVAPYRNGTARPVPWNAGLDDDEHPSTDFATAVRWNDTRVAGGQHVGVWAPDRVVSGRLRCGVILPVDREEKNPDGITIIDWDDVRDPETGEVHPVALEAIRDTGGYVAISQSGKGLHQWVYGEIPGGLRKFMRHIDDEPFVGDDRPQVEIYTTGRLVAMTGEHVAGTGGDVVDGQGLIDRLCWEYGTASNSAPGIPTDPFAGDRDRDDAEDGEQGAEDEDGTGTGTDRARSVPSHETVGEALRDAVTYDGDDPAEWDIPDDDARSLDYHAVLRARERSDELPTVANWELIGYAAALGYRDGLEREQVVADLEAHPTPQYGFDRRRADSETKSVYRKVKNGTYGPPNRSTLVARGILPDEYDRDDDRGGDREHVALLPPAPNSPQARARAAEWGGLAAQVQAPTAGTGSDEGGSAAPSIDDVRERLFDAIDDAMDRHDQVAIDAIMGGGKTYTAFLAAYERDEPILYVAGRTDLYEQGEAYARDVGFDDDEIYVLPSLEDCSTFAGDHGDAWKDRVETLYRRGVRPAKLHALVDVPCCEGDRTCEYQARHDFDPDDYAVIIGHHKHAHVPRVSAGRHVVVDENPTGAFLGGLYGETLIRGVNAFLALADSPPVDGFDDLLAARRDAERRQEALAWFGSFDFEPDEQNAVRFENEGFHAYAPHAVYTILAAEPVPADDDDGDEQGADGGADDPDGRRYPFEKASIPGVGNGALFFATDEQHGEYFVEIQTPPELNYANAVIALDGTPLLDPTDGDPAEWELALGRPLNHRQVLTDGERADFLAETMGHTYIQTTPYVRPYSSGKYNDIERDAGLLAAASEQYLGGDPWDVVITSLSVRLEYEQAGLADADRGLVRSFEHGGAIRGSDEYAEASSGVILGSSHHGDHELARRAAWLGARVDPRGKGVDREYGDVGDTVLRQMRELATAQRALRIGRGEDGRGALVLLDTAAIPDWIPVANADRPGDVAKWGRAERYVRDAARSIADDRDRERDRDADGDRRLVYTTDDIRDAIDEDEDGRDAPTPRSIQRALRRHADRGLVDAEDHPGDGRRILWTDTGLAALDRHAGVTVDLPALEPDGGASPPASTAEGDADGGEGDSDKPPITTIRVLSLLSRERKSAPIGGRGSADNASEAPADGDEPPPDPPAD